MKSVLSGLVTALSMYSVFPMPQLEWNQHTMKYAMCFFPFVGIVVGAFVYLWVWICGFFSLNTALAAVVLALLPVLLSGGIHLDGLIDTSDALSSHQPAERKLEILKDSHVGAFGVIICVSYLLLCFGFGMQFFDHPQLILLLCLGYVLSRGYSALAVVSFRLARDTGLAHAFCGQADKTVVKATSLLYILAASAGMILIDPMTGCIAVAAAFLWLLLFRRICYSKFGGLTGDLAGYSLCITELLVLIAAAVGGLA
ncbi:MAG: adenosylcobinamide-GDP ribazoletransferase [Christensenella hongkongensis]|uniref:adenosylcobinamide-GDP ribazoletransferase n=1 Tax=Christensenella hongkongensis TaxID=270498 RepID=UPI002673A9FE|nr:adenosylcobinamide-GDP ribazoletransferase [Christensenella hongkongensis]MDY3004479.1 adenosylcobinamide-GDP ribazoletransferase [Christensenella hongkongensis]